MEDRRSIKMEVCTDYLQSRTIKDYSHANSILLSLSRLAMNGDLIDVIIKIGQKEYGCHRVILAASSPYFESMFLHGFSEGHKRIIEMDDVSHVGFEILLNFIYTGEMTVTNRNATDLYVIADKYLYDNVRKITMKYIIDDVKTSNCVKYLTFAEKYDLRDVNERCISTIVNNFDGIRITELVSLSYQSALNIVMSEYSDCENEVKFLCFICDWLESNVAHKDSKNALIDSIRWGILTQTELECIKEKTHKLGDRCNFWTHLMNRYYRETCSGKMSMETQYIYQFSHRKMKMRATIGSRDTHDNDTYGDIRWPHSDKKIIQLPNPLCHTASVTIGNHIVVIGGRSEQRDGGKYVEATVMAYNIIDRTWHRLSNMLSRRWQHVAVVCNGYILVLGGRDERGRVRDSVEKYDIALNKWTQMGSFVRKCTHPKGCSVDGDIYISGGLFFDDSLPTNMRECVRAKRNVHIYKYDEKNDVWQKICRLPRISHDRKSDIVSMCTVNNLIYIHGYDRLKNVTYDPITNIVSLVDLDPQIPIKHNGDVLLPYLDYLCIGNESTE